MTNTLELFIEKQTILSNQVVASMLGWMGVCGVGGLLTPGNTPFAEPNPKKLVEKTIFEKTVTKTLALSIGKHMILPNPIAALRGLTKSSNTHQFLNQILRGFLRKRILKKLQPKD